MQMTIRLLLAGFMLIAAGTPLASPSRPPPIDELTQFYEAMGGDDWHRNDHWLDEDINYCQWYGIRCELDLSLPAMKGIEMPYNNLAGNLGDVVEVLTDLIRISSGSSVNLAGNRIKGSIPGGLLQGRLETIDLSHNDLSGQLPDHELLNTRLRTLMLSGNRLEGSLEPLAHHSELRRLELADNRFEGPFPDSLLALEQLFKLDLSGNAFSGPLPSALTDLSWIWPNAHALGGLNLCWNDFEVDSEELDEWLRAHHAGVEYERCLGVERQPLDASVSGTWFQPSRAGEGSTLQLLDTGNALIYWFTFTRFGNQMWLFGTASDVDLDGPTIDFPVLYRPDGFPSMEGPMTFDLVRRGQWRYDRRADGRLGGLQVYDINISVSGFERQPVGLRVDHEPLTRINATRCNDNPDLPDISGVWHNPDVDMDGFVVELMPDGQVLVYWFTWVPGTALQAWMMGVGDLVGDGRVIIEELHRPTGTRFGDNFDPEEVTRPVWGQLELVFDDELNGHAWWTSDNEDWESGERAIERLSRPMLAECE